MKARANPANIVYSWSKDGVEIPQLSDVDNYVNKEGSRIAAHGSELHITTAERADAGHYTLKAMNDEGSSVNNILLNVQREYFVSLAFLSLHRSLISLCFTLSQLMNSSTSDYP